MSVDFDTALSLLPHGPGFRFLDRISELKPGVNGKGHYLVRGDEPFLKAHFPGEPLMPGVLLIEAGAQLAGVVAQTDPARKPLAGLKLAAIRGVKITGSAKPGDLIEIDACVSGRMPGLVQASINISVFGQQVAGGEITLSGTERPS